MSILKGKIYRYKKCIIQQHFVKRDWHVYLQSTASIPPDLSFQFTYNCASLECLLDPPIKCIFLFLVKCADFKNNCKLRTSKTNVCEVKYKLMKENCAKSCAFCG